MKKSAIPARWRAPLTLVALFAIGFVTIFGYTKGARIGIEPGGETQALQRPIAVADVEPPALRPDIATQEASPATSVSEPASPQAITDETVAKWIADVTAHDTTKRTAAISALSEAPKSKAVPALRNLLTAGDPKTDRPLALRSLHKLALKQGDTDGAIREVLRQATYHADDEATASGAQDMLADIERVISEAATD